MTKKCYFFPPASIQEKGHIVSFSLCSTMQRQVLQRAVTATLKKHEEISQRDKLVYKPHS